MKREVAFVKTFGFGYLTQTAGTAIVRSVYPRKNRAGGRNPKTRIGKVMYLAGATAHTLTVMRPLGTTTLSAAAAASQAVINITADAQAPSAAGALAANDYVILELADGTYQTGIVSSVSTLAVTLTANLTAAAAAGAKVWMFGVAGDHTDTYDLTNGATTTLDSSLPGRKGLGFVSSRNAYEPIILSINNATNQGFLLMTNGGYAYE